jgi:hypothetical protein
VVDLGCPLWIASSRPELAHLRCASAWPCSVLRVLVVQSETEQGMHRRCVSYYCIGCEVVRLVHMYAPRSVVASVEFPRSVRRCPAVLVRKGPPSGLTTSGYIQLSYASCYLAQVLKTLYVDVLVVYSVPDITSVDFERHYVGLHYRFTPL